MTSRTWIWTGYFVSPSGLAGSVERLVVGSDYSDAEQFGGDRCVFGWYALFWMSLAEFYSVDDPDTSRPLFGVRPPIPAAIPVGSWYTNVNGFSGELVASVDSQSTVSG